MNLEDALKQNPHTKRIVELEGLEGKFSEGHIYPTSKLDLLPQITVEKSRERAWDEGVQFCYDQGWRLIPSKDEFRQGLLGNRESDVFDTMNVENVRLWLLDLSCLP